MSARILPKNLAEISKILPHRYPFLLVDRVVDWNGKDSLVALKNVTINEPFFQGHFPGHPVMPGVLQIEALAQAALILAYMRGDFNPEKQLVFFAAIESARFKREVVPGDVLLLKVSWVAARQKVCKISGQAIINDEVAAEAQLTAVAKDL